MTKAEIVERVAAQTRLPKQQTAEIVNAFLQSIMDALGTGDKVEVRGFGSFRCRQRRPRTGRNPKTGLPVQVPAKMMPVFKASKAMQARLNSAEPVSQRR